MSQQAKGPGSLCQLRQGHHGVPEFFEDGLLGGQHGVFLGGSKHRCKFRSFSSLWHRCFALLHCYKGPQKVLVAGAFGFEQCRHF